ncbi:MAG: hypothetical protein QNJ37_22515 [Crocosphaera sp.]|nr:hypothetical protein [Crocosphaera sp.]
MKRNKSNILLINTLVSLLGLVIVLIGIVFEENNPKVKAFLDPVGIGLIASGGVNFLDKVLAQENNEDSGSKVEILATQRIRVDARIHDKKYSAKKIDIVGVNLNNCLREIVEEPHKQMIKNIFSGKTERLRLLFVDPNAQFISQRALEDGIPESEIIRRQRESIRMCISFYKLLKYERDQRHHNHETDGNCNVEIRLIDFCPHITIERYDDECYWGLYTSDDVGVHSAIFKISSKGNDILFEQLKKHFSGLQTKRFDDTQDNLLLKMTLGKLWLNEPLVESRLDTHGEELAQLLDSTV